jgi:Crp-like helix-turn-helix domain
VRWVKADPTFFLKTDYASLEYLRVVSWLMDAVPSSERPRVESVLRSCSMLSLRGGSALRADRFEPGSLLLIEDGLVFVAASTGGSARRIVVGVAGSGSVLLPPGTHERLEGLADTRITLVSSGANRRLLEIPAAAVEIADAIKRGLHDGRESLALFASRRPADRVRRKLIQLAHNYGKVGTDGLILDMPLTHELLADMIGSTRETVTRALAQLAHEGIIRHERGRYRIAVPPDPSRLVAHQTTTRRASSLRY